MKKFAAILVLILVCSFPLSVGAILYVDESYTGNVERDGIIVNLSVLRYEEVFEEYGYKAHYYYLSGSTNADSVSISGYDISSFGLPDAKSCRPFQLDLRAAHNMNPFGEEIVFRKGDSFVTIKLESETNWYIFDSSAMTGDVNGDRQVNSTDISALKRCLLMRTLLPFYSEVADINGDGEINSTDFTYLKRFILRTIDRFPKDVIEVK